MLRYVRSIMPVLLLVPVSCGPVASPTPTTVAPSATGAPRPATSAAESPTVQPAPTPTISPAPTFTVAPAASPSPSATVMPAESPTISVTASATATPAAGQFSGEIAYLWNRTIYLLDPRTGEQRQVTGEETPANDVAWAPDGRRLAFSGGVEDPEIYTVAPDGSDLTRVTHSPLPEAFPAYAPDGTLFFVRRTPDPARPTIDIVRHTGGAETVVYSQPGGLCGATGLHFGSNTEFALSLSCGRGSHVLLGDLQTGQTTDLGATYLAPEAGCAYRAAWPWQERRLVTVTSVECLPQQNATVSIIQLDPAAARSTPLYTAARIGHVDWAPDRQMLVFSAGAETGDASELWLLDLRQSEPRRVAETGSHPVWRPAPRP